MKKSKKHKIVKKSHKTSKSLKNYKRTKIAKSKTPNFKMALLGFLGVMMLLIIVYGKESLGTSTYAWFNFKLPFAKIFNKLTITPKSMLSTPYPTKLYTTKAFYPTNTRSPSRYPTQTIKPTVKLTVKPTFKLTSTPKPTMKITLKPTTNTKPSPTIKSTYPSPK
jgi:hypothetical protein